MTKLETTFAITFIGSLFIIKVLLKDNEMLSIACVFILGYLLHFSISKFESTSGTEFVKVDETNMYNNVLKGIPIIVDNGFSFDEFLNKCNKNLHDNFYQSCFEADCYEYDRCLQHYLNNQKHFSNLLKQNLKQK